VRESHENGLGNDNIVSRKAMTLHRGSAMVCAETIDRFSEVSNQY
jgi:hypothetical protein